MQQKMLALLSPLIATATLSADSPAAPAAPFMQSEILPKDQYPAAYNAPSQVKLVNSQGKWLPDLFIDASFIYYYGDQDGLDLGTSAALIIPVSGPSVVATSNAKVINQKFEYKPGFKVGIGGRFDEWTLAGEYTWIRQTTHTHRSTPNTNLSDSSGVWVLDDWFQQLAPNGQGISASSLSSRWHAALDLADLTLSRSFYQGRSLSITPSFGVRAGWIRQKVKVNIALPAAFVTPDVLSTVASNNSSRSWGLGPRAALEADCLLGMGFRLEGDVAASLLFTQYTHVRHQENVANTTATPSTLQTEYSNYNCLRPIGEIGLGLGWGSYFSSQKYHFDFLASYDFLIFWNQNMIRKLLDTATAGVGSSAGDLHFNGLTLTARLDF